MGIMRRYGQSRQRALAAGRVESRDVELAGDVLGRCEAEALAAPVKAADPYAEWLALREEERKRDRPAIRWVYTPETARPAGESRPDSDAGLVIA